MLYSQPSCAALILPMAARRSALTCAALAVAIMMAFVVPPPTAILSRFVVSGPTPMTYVGIVAFTVAAAVATLSGLDEQPFGSPSVARTMAIFSPGGSPA